MDTKQLDRAFVSTRSIVAMVRPDQLAAPTPCVSWDVRALINHFTGSARWAAATVAGGSDESSEDYAAGDFLASYDESIRLALEAFGADGALERTVSLPWGESSGAELMELCAREQFIHGWDLAHAAGLPVDLDPELAAELLAGAPSAIGDELRGPEGTAFFGPAVAAPAGSGPADQLAAFLGRPIPGHSVAGHSVAGHSVTGQTM
jgi:uncharacterized protein (TIGR03086 family)